MRTLNRPRVQQHALVLAADSVGGRYVVKGSCACGWEEMDVRLQDVQHAYTRHLEAVLARLA